jgi:hypothetical protein
MNLPQISHFGCIKDVNNCIKKLLELVHGGSLWLDRLALIVFDLITKITGLPTDGEKPKKYLDDKTKEKTLAEEMKKAYGIVIGSKGIIMNRISEPATRMETKLME